MVVTIWLVKIECDQKGLKQECILGLGDNTSAICWLFKTKGIKKEALYHDAVTFVARSLAELMPSTDHCLASQHIPGKQNTVSDLLSFQGSDRKSEFNGTVHPLSSCEILDEELTTRFHRHLPQLIPQDFKISPLPNEVESFVIQAMQIAESSWIRSKSHLTKESTASGGDGQHSAKTSWETSTLSSMTHQQQKSTSYFEPSSRSIGELNSISKEDFVNGVRNRWYRRVSEVPLALWQRNSGTVSNGHPFTNKTAKGTFRP